jgi:hypothetical protein
MLWGTSSFALYIPWAHGSGPYLGISLWLWLGVLDAIQGAGLGMILLQVISRDFLAPIYDIPLISSFHRRSHDFTFVQLWHFLRSSGQSV